MYKVIREDILRIEGTSPMVCYRLPGRRAMLPDRQKETEMCVREIGAGGVMTSYTPQDSKGTWKSRLWRILRDESR
jgi:hypothetical protein